MAKCERCGKNVNLITRYIHRDEKGVEKTYCWKCGDIVHKEQEAIIDERNLEKQKKIQEKEQQEEQRKIEERKKSGKYCQKCGDVFGYLEETEKIKEDGIEKIVCKDCFRDWQGQVINQLKKSPEGRKELYNIGSYLINRGILITIAGIIINVILLSIAINSESSSFIYIFWGIVVFGIYDILKGTYYKSKYGEKV